MQFSHALVLAFAASALAVTVQKGSPVKKARSPVMVARQFATSAIGGCSPGSYQCADLASNGNLVCTSCAIAVGNSGGQCELNNECRTADGSCQYNNGEPFCE